MKKKFVVTASVLCCYCKCIVLLLQVYCVVTASVLCCYCKCILFSAFYGHVTVQCEITINKHITAALK